MKFTEDHEWLLKEDDYAIVGITEHDAEALGDLVFVELPDVGTSVSKGDQIVVIESVKADSDLTSPRDGEIIEVNEQLTEKPKILNDDPHSAAWFFKMKLTGPSEIDNLMDEDAYKELIG